MILPKTKEIAGGFSPSTTQLIISNSKLLPLYLTTADNKTQKDKNNIFNNNNNKIASKLPPPPPPPPPPPLTAASAMKGCEAVAPLLDLKRLKVVSALGRGAKGVVFLVKDEEAGGESFALKVISRESVERKGKGQVNDGSEYKRICFEQRVLSRFNHPLLPRLRGVWATEKVVGYGIDYCAGRDLNSLRKQQGEKMFSTEMIRFYAAELVLALEYLHNLGIVYRDLKPENILIQENGHIMLVDFDLSTKLSPISRETTPISSVSGEKKRPSRRKRFLCSPCHRFCHSGITPEDSPELGRSAAAPEQPSGEKSTSFVGTEEYVAPEIVQGHGHDFAVDWWSLGVVLYEMLYGYTPFKGANRKETFYRIVTKTADLVGEATPLRDLIAKLLAKEPKQRLGLKGIKGHDFFKGLDWDLVLQISRPPYIPAVNEVMGPEGIIDVEAFVQGIFGSGGGEGKKDKDTGVEGGGHDDGDEKEEENGTCIINQVENPNKGVWVKGLNDHGCDTEKFLVF